MAQLPISENIASQNVSIMSGYKVSYAADIELCNAPSMDVHGWDTWTARGTLNCSSWQTVHLIWLKLFVQAEFEARMSQLSYSKF